jgi:hypothetical protein
MNPNDKWRKIKKNDANTTSEHLKSTNSSGFFTLIIASIIERAMRTLTATPKIYRPQS